MSNIKFNDYLYEKLRNPEYQKEWLRQVALEYIKEGNYNQFFSDLEDVIKANCSISQYAKKVDMDRVQLTKILHGKTKTPSITKINKILAGLGLECELKCEITLQEKTA